MKYSINLLLWTDTLSQDKLPLLDKMKSIGFDSVELPMFDRDVANAAAWGKALDNLGLSRSGTCAFGPDDHLISDDPVPVPQKEASLSSTAAYTYLASIS